MFNLVIFRYHKMHMPLMTKSRWLCSKKCETTNLGVVILYVRAFLAQLNDIVSEIHGS